MISVVIPSYKNLQLCQQAVASVMRQKGCDYEIIITDDTPGGEIEDWIKSLNSNIIRYYHNIPSKGAIDNWNYGLSLADGDGVILLHHDEAFANDGFLKSVEDKLSKYDVVVHNKRIMLGRTLKKDRVPFLLKKIGFAFNYLLFALNFIGPCACVAFRKNVCVEFDSRLHWLVDSEWYYRLLRNARTSMYFNTIEIISHHGHEGQITNNINIKEVADQDRSIIRDKYHSFCISFFLCVGKLLSKQG